MKRIFSEVFIHFFIPHFIPLLLNIMFAWNFSPNVSKFCYKPALVFKEFSVESLMSGSYNCICAKFKRLAQFVDPGTMDDNYHDPRAHLRTMNTRIIHHHGLREAITLGLNHVPLKNTNIQEAIQVVVNTFVHVCQLLKVEGCLDVKTHPSLFGP